MLVSSQIADRSQSCSFSLGHRRRGIRGDLIGGQAVQQNAGFLLGADRGHLQDRSAVAGFDEALLVARWSDLTVKYIAVQNAPFVDGVIKQAKGGLVPRDNPHPHPMSVVGELILLPKLQRQRSDDASAFDVGDAVGGICNCAPAWTLGSLDLPYLNGNPRRALGMFVHAMADKLRQIGFGNRLLCHRSPPSDRNLSSKLSRPAVLASLDVKSTFLQTVTSSHLLLDAGDSCCQMRVAAPFGSIRQSRPIAPTNWDDRDFGVGQISACKLLVKEPDELVGGSFLFGMDVRRQDEVGV
ncbi:hypothetical protein AB8A20_07945 [Tardiphaga sp. 604_B6_N1_1]|uniref:hypothetical protein n=1 Tax=unclassified Tardiphaga TaxID=2631404 RepID=UPI003F23CF03